jgi:hypothetical protein
MEITPSGIEQTVSAPNIRKIQIHTASDLKDTILTNIQWEERVAKAGGSFKAYNGRMEVLKHGVYEIDRTVEVERTITQGHLVDQQSVFLHGEGYGNTVLKVVEPNVTLFNFRNMRLNMGRMQVEGNTDGTSTFMKLGDEATDKPIFQSGFRDIFVNGFNKAFVFGQLFDSIFDNIFILGMNGTTPVIFDVLAHYVDNTNNLLFNRVHTEQAAAATFLKTRSGLGSNQYHHNLQFKGLHMETRAWNTRCIDAEGLRFSKFEGMFNRNNTSPTGDGVAYTDAVPIARLKDCQGIKFDGGAMQHIGATHADTPKLVRIEGATKGIIFEDMFMATGLTETSPGIDDIIDNAGSVPTEDAVKFRNVVVNDLTNAPINSATRISSKTDGNRIFGFSVETNAAGASDLVGQYSNAANGQTKTNLFRAHSSGMFNTGPIAPHTQQSIANGASFSYSIPNPDGANTNKRGRYSIFENGPDNGVVAEIYSNGSQIDIIYAGANVACASGATSTTDPNVAAKLNIFLTGTSITLFNRVGNTRTFCLQAMGPGLTG